MQGICLSLWVGCLPTCRGSHEVNGAQHPSLLQHPIVTGKATSEAGGVCACSAAWFQRSKAGQVVHAAPLEEVRCGGTARHSHAVRPCALRPRHQLQQVLIELHRVLHGHIEQARVWAMRPGTGTCSACDSSAAPCLKQPSVSIGGEGRGGAPQTEQDAAAQTRREASKCTAGLPAEDQPHSG